MEPVRKTKYTCYSTLECLRRAAELGALGLWEAIGGPEPCGLIISSATDISETRDYCGARKSGARL